MTYLKRAGASILFLMGLLALLFLVSILVVPKDNTEEAGMEEIGANGILGEPENTIDVLVLGDSEARSSIIPPELWKQKGYTAYVCGTSNQTLPYSFTMLDRALQKQKPKIVILETLAIYRSIPSDDAVIDVLSRRFPVFRYHDRWKKLQPRDLSRERQATYRYYSKGHWTSQRVQPSSEETYMIPTQDTASIDPLNRLYVRAIKARCDRIGAKLVLLSSPSSFNWNYRKHNGIQKLAKELGCEYVDMNLINDRLKIDWTVDTRDKGDHLNHTGAVKASAFLAGYLQDTHLLTDHRDDAAFTSWQEDVKKYEDEIG